MADQKNMEEFNEHLKDPQTVFERTAHKAITAAWHYMQSPASYSRTEKEFAFRQVDDAMKLIREQFENLRAK